MFCSVSVPLPTLTSPSVLRFAPVTAPLNVVLAPSLPSVRLPPAASSIVPVPVRSPTDAVLLPTSSVPPSRLSSPVVARCAKRRNPAAGDIKIARTGDRTGEVGAERADIDRRGGGRRQRRVDIGHQLRARHLDGAAAQIERAGAAEPVIVLHQAVAAADLQLAAVEVVLAIARRRQEQLAARFDLQRAAGLDDLAVGRCRRPSRVVTQDELGRTAGPAGRR